MKLKGINPFEQHVEKIVLGVLSVVALGVVASQFLLEPNKVTIGSGEALPPDRAYEPVEKAANDLLAKVNSDGPTLPAEPKVDVLERFQKRLDGAVAPRPEIVALGARINFGGERDLGGPTGTGAVAALAVPAPSIPAARSFGGTIDPLEVALAPELQRIVPKEQPFDKFAVSVEATFDGTALKAALNADPDGEAGPQRPIPIGWWRDAVEIVGVELEREKLLPGGTWGEAKVLGGIPARYNLLGEIQNRVRSSGDMPAMIEQARQHSREILTPDYYTMIAGIPWTAPTEAQAVTGGPGAKVDQLQKKLNDLDGDIERIEKQMAKNDQQKQKEQSKPDVRSPGGKGQGAEQSRPQERGAPGRDAAKPAAKTPLEKKQAERERVALELESLKEQAEKPATTRTGEGATKKQMLDDQRVRVWAHDVAAEPGAEYRYRLRVIVNNPLFGKEGSLPASQKEAASQALARGNWSEWTDPVQVDNNRYFFITNAQERDAIGNNRASADLMEFFYGYYRRASVSLEPGDPILADVKLPTDLREFDLTKLAAGIRPKQQPDAVPETIDERGGERDGRVIVKNPKAPALDPRKQPEDAAAVPDEVSSPLKRKLESINTGAMLLDVAPTPAAGGKAGLPRVFVRDAAGLIQVKTPEPQGPDSLYAKLLASAKAGETQGKPKVKPADTKPDANAPGRRPSELQPRKDDGGGGGGGGG